MEPVFEQIQHEITPVETFQFCTLILHWRNVKALTSLCGTLGLSQLSTDASTKLAPGTFWWTRGMSKLVFQDQGHSVPCRPVAGF